MSVCLPRHYVNIFYEPVYRELRVANSIVKCISMQVARDTLY